MATDVYIILADGFEETEAIAPLDLFRRAGLRASLVSVTGSRSVVGSQGLVVIADMLFESIHCSPLALVLPGGPGHAALYEHDGLAAFIRDCAKNDEILFCAICASPIVLAKHGVLDGKRAVCYPGFEDRLGGAVYEDANAVTDGNVITSKGPGTAVPFALAIIERLCGAETAESVASSFLAIR